MWIESITAYNAANLEKLKSNPKNKVVFPSQAQLDEAQKLLTPGPRGMGGGKPPAQGFEGRAGR